MSGWHRMIRDLAREHGASLEVARGGHLCIRHPSGWQVFASSTPGDRRSLQNTAALVRRVARQQLSQQG